MSKEFIFELDYALYNEETGEAVFKPKVVCELVRCGECKRHEEPRDTGLKAFVWCNFYNMYKLKDGYCNCGERKDGERKDDGTTAD